MARKFPEGSEIFQQDLAPCHTCQKVKNFINLNNISVLDWPGNSPDLNPIENFWSKIKLRLRRIDCATMVKLIEAIIDCWYRDPQIQENCKKLMDSMTKRVKSVTNGVLHPPCPCYSKTIACRSWKSSKR